jgi:Holliday junction resolvase RusA-like endonuclease
MSILLDITPVPKPRQTRSDKWKKRPSVMRYRAFADEVRLRLPSDFDLNYTGIQFCLPMPKSWNDEKRQEMDGKPHTQVPDLSNLLKALEDAVYADDSTIHTYEKLTKIWGKHGSISIERAIQEIK